MSMGVMLKLCFSVIKWSSLVVFIFNLWSEIVSDVTDVSDLVLDDKGHLRRHRQRHGRGKIRCLREHVEVPASEGESDWLLHLNSDSFLLLKFKII